MKKITLMALFVAFFNINAQVVLSEDFEASLSLPTGWTNINAGADPNEIWTFSNSPDFQFFFAAGNGYFHQFAGSGNYAFFNSDFYQENGLENVSLTSPVFDCSNLTDVTLDYNHFIAAGDGTYNGAAHVEVFNGSTWVEVSQHSPSTIAADAGGLFWDYGSVSLDVSSQLAGVSNAQVRFRYQAISDWAYGWQVDDIVVKQCTASAPVAVTSPTLPTDAATGVEISYGLDNDNIINFEWPSAPEGNEVDSYTFNIGVTPNGNDIGSLSVDNNLVNLIYAWTANTTYYWSIDSVNCSGTSVGTVFSFTTAACTAFSAPPAVITPTPTNNATIALDNSDPETPNAVVFSWVDPESTEGSYVLYLDTDPTLITAQTFNNFGNGTAIFGLLDNTTYYWKIESYNCFGFTSSVTWSFTTSTTAGINDTNQNLFSVFPNPVKDILNIKGNGLIDNVEVINQLGQRVLSINGSLLANNQINLSKLNTGIYFVKVKSASKTEILQVIKQ